ncbi:histone deacetylase 6 isoform X2 [Phlebotomus papatasi]|uniref:histone deacetylase 6 isoform X2 n=1 Tax=Phlebotomus papatasi TaxID=29031 RepID=UPI002483C6E6|nr:histone deacetylase 6 isoform X2 [Phlebotomus papatasi]
MSSPVVTRRAAQKAKIQTRSVASGTARPQSSALLEAKKRARQKISSGEKRNSDIQTLRDPYQTTMEARNLIHGATGLVYDRQMAQHLCLWDENYPECPARLTSVLDRCQELKLFERCQKIDPKPATKEQILLKHTEEHFEILKKTSGSHDEVALEDLSSRFDAIYIHPGEMEVTPAAYTHLLSPLMSLAEGKVAVILEGGYCLRSLAEGAALTLRTLLGDPCPNIEPLEAPCESVQETILNCISVQRPFWKCLQVHRTYGLEEVNNINPPRELHQVVSVFKGITERPERFDTRNCYPVQNEERIRTVNERLQRLEMSTNLRVAPNRVCLVYDEAMAEHRNVFEVHPECPKRITSIWDKLGEFGVVGRMHRVGSRVATVEELCLVHSPEHVKLMEESVQRKDLEVIGEQYNSVYFHSSTWNCATLAAGSVLQVVDDVLNGNSRCGVCVVRPPGHHAESDLPHGFCIFNNVSVAAEYAVRSHGLKRVLIVDWDVHHGNGTQHIFETRRDVLYISLHRFDQGNFFPKGPDGDYVEVGSGTGEGFNVNIPWNRRGMGDAEYTAAFHNIIMPIAYEFDPELVLVSAGFDAAIGDPLGGCKVSPEAYGHFTHWLSSLANGRVIICLEGGYNVNSIAYAMTMCSKALLGDPLPPLDICNRDLNSSCIETIRNVLSVQKKYWKCLKFNKKVPNFVSEDTTNLSEMVQGMTISDEPCDSDSTNERTRNAGNEPQPGPSGSRGEVKKDHQSLSDYLAENAAALANEEMFAVVPLKNCPHLALLDPSQAPNEINTNVPCEECASPRENWICLHCFRTLCGRYVGEHMLYHHLDTEHPLALSFSDLSVWCYKCESYIDNPMLYKYKNMAHVSKFGGEEMVWPYGSDTLHLTMDGTPKN